MSETPKSRPQPYIEQRPGNQILASDWNDMQVQIREEIAATLADVTTLRQELVKLKALRQEVADEVAALQSEVKTARLSVSGDATVEGKLEIQGDTVVQGNVRSKGGRFGEIAAGTAAHGDIGYAYESIQVGSEHNIRFCFGNNQRFLFHNNGQLDATSLLIDAITATSLRVQSLSIGDFRLETDNGWLRIIGAGEKMVARFSSAHHDRVHIFRDADGHAPYWYYNKDGLFGHHV